MKHSPFFPQMLVLFLAAGLLCSCHKAEPVSLLDRVQGQWVTECWVDNEFERHLYPNEMGVSFGYDFQGDQLTIYQLRAGIVDNLEVQGTVTADDEEEKLLVRFPVDELTVRMELRLESRRKLVNVSRIRPDSRVVYHLRRKSFKKN